MLRPAYAVEYDYLPAHQCDPSLQTKRISGLFFSGQLNGTTGAHPPRLVAAQQSRSINLWAISDSLGKASLAVDYNVLWQTLCHLETWVLMMQQLGSTARHRVAISSVTQHRL